MIEFLGRFIESLRFVATLCCSMSGLNSSISFLGWKSKFNILTHLVDSRFINHLIMLAFLSLDSDVQY